MKKRVVITGRLSAGLMIALALEGLEIAQHGNEFNVRKQPDCRGIALTNAERFAPITHGPQRKGKGGKVTRW